MFTQWFKLSQLSKLIFTEVVWYSLQWQPLYHCQPAVPAIAQRGSIGEDNTWNMEDMHECVCVDCLRPVAITILPPLFLYFFFCFSITNGELSSAEENLKTKYLKTETVSRKCALWNMHTCTHTHSLSSLFHWPNYSPLVSSPLNFHTASDQSWILTLFPRYQSDLELVKHISFHEDLNFFLKYIHLKVKMYFGTLHIRWDIELDYFTHFPPLTAL